ncbi:putative receptor-like protein 12-like [Capsicum annuum]|uniref:Helicase C-terminal domain-containing protein n=1 Tax=Capsicum annuum TaxID=4072 RepID=A0A2G2ZIB1_CAPAN|nr:putative receptor-like protein 12-like [Capsicum annuum]PHT81703.1 hypothetical protein T459_14718 [Capsicum annuum]
MSKCFVQACLEGISLIGVSRLVFLDIVWNPSVKQQASSRSHRNGQKKFVYVYFPVTSKWEVGEIEQQMRKKNHPDILLSWNEVYNSCYRFEDNILVSMVKHEVH